MKADFKEIMKDVVDIHVHAGPSVAERSVDACEMWELANQAGYKAVVIKDHYFPSMLGTRMIEKYFNEDGTKTHIYGSACVNNATGAFNLNTVDVSIAMGAKVIWMPTLSSWNHMQMHKGKFVGGGNTTVLENPIYSLNEDGSLKIEVVDFLKLMAQHPDVVLGTGHLSPKELDVIIPKALELGVKKVLVNHPHFIIFATREDVARWAEMGAYIEINGAIFERVTGSPKSPNIPIGWIKNYLEDVPLNQLIIDSDSGQKGSLEPVEALYNFFNVLLEEGVSRDKIDIMAKVNPAKLININ